MFGVRVSIAENICLLYLSISSCILMLCKILGWNLGFFGGGTFPPDVPRINTAFGLQQIQRSARLLS